MVEQTNIYNVLLTESDSDETLDTPELEQTCADELEQTSADEPKPQEKLFEIRNIEDFESLINNTDNKLDGKRFIFVDCWAPWCGPCRAIMPTIENFSKTYYQNIYYAKINCDEFDGFSDLYDITALPSFMTFKVGDKTPILGTIVGAKVAVIEGRLKDLNSLKTDSEDF